jgi:hypothetical protein
MADPKSFASTYAVASTDKDMLNKRRDLASRLFQAKQAGKTMEEALTSESGVDVRNLQKGSVDTKMGTGLTEEEVAGFAERLYAGKYGGQSTTPTTAQGSGSVFDQQEEVAQAASAASGAFGGPNSKGASSQFQAPSPRLDKLAAMQGSPIGSMSSLGQRRSLESEGGKAMRMARKLERQGFSGAAQQMALAGAQAKLSEPSIKTEAYRQQQAALGQQTQAMNQEALDAKKKELELKKTMLQNAQKEASSPTGFSPSTMAYFGGVQK